MIDARDFYPAIRAKIGTKSTVEWIEIFSAENVQVGRVNNYADIVNDPQVKENGYLVEFCDDNDVTRRFIGSPIQFSHTPTRVKRSAPQLGEHTEEVLRASGFSAAELNSLKEKGIA